MKIILSAVQNFIQEKTLFLMLTWPLWLGLALVIACALFLVPLLTFPFHLW